MSPFDKTRWKDWDEDSTETRTNKEHRVREICKVLDIEIPPDEIRYQLLHRCASAVLEALRFQRCYSFTLLVQRKSGWKIFKILYNSLV